MHHPILASQHSITVDLTWMGADILVVPTSTLLVLAIEFPSVSSIPINSILSSEPPPAPRISEHSRSRELLIHILLIE
jgi:hypothetical protein